jgi:hypothetical protein
VKSVVARVRSKFAEIIRNIDGDPGPLSALATCKNSTDASIPPCLHSVNRTSDHIRTYLFPLNFPILVSERACRAGSSSIATQTLTNRCLVVGLEARVPWLWPAVVCECASSVPPDEAGAPDVACPRCL